MHTQEIRDMWLNVISLYMYRLLFLRYTQLLTTYYVITLLRNHLLRYIIFASIIYPKLSILGYVYNILFYYQ